MLLGVVSLLLAVTFSALAADAWNMPCSVSFSHTGVTRLTQWSACEVEIGRLRQAKLRTLDGSSVSLADEMARNLDSIKLKSFGYALAAALCWLVFAVAAVRLLRKPKGDAPSSDR